MNKVKIIVDSTADLTPEYLRENDITVIPLGVSFGEKHFKDSVDIDTEELYRIADQTGELPKTSAISVGEFIERFKPFIEEGYDIFYTGISSKMSSSFNNASIAAQEFEAGRIVIYDSYNLSTGIGLQVLKAVRLRNEGKNAAEIREELMKIRNGVRSQFLIEKLDYLFKGGRCSSLAYFFGKNFHIKPIIRVTNGSMLVYKKPIGRTINACNALLDIFKKDLGNIDPDCVMLTSSIAPESEKYLYQKLCELIDPSRIMVTHAGCVISSHCGKGTVGILYILKDQSLN